MEVEILFCSYESASTALGVTAKKIETHSLTAPKNLK